MIKILSDEEALLHHHSTLWIKRSESGVVDIITAEKPDEDSGSYKELKVRCEAKEFESTLLHCANSGLSVREYSADSKISIMDRHRIKMIANDHLAESEA